MNLQRRINLTGLHKTSESHIEKSLRLYCGHQPDQRAVQQTGGISEGKNVKIYFNRKTKCHKAS